jgi:hypothetical protein
VSAFGHMERQLWWDAIKALRLKQGQWLLA